MRKILFFWISIIPLCSPQAQTSEQTYLLAVKNMECGHYESAVEALNRFVFFSNKKTNSEAFLLLGDCYIALERFEMAHNFYDQCFFTAKSDSLKNELVLKKAGAYILQDKHTEALTLLYNQEEFIKDEKRKNFYMGLAWYGKAEFIKSKKCFLSIPDSLHKSVSDTITLLFDNLQKIKLSPKKAKHLSMILPGLGQLYAGDYKNSLNSFALNACFITLGIATYFQYTLFDAFLFVGPWWRKYYVGGYKKAELNALERLRKKREPFLKKIMLQLEKE